MQIRPVAGSFANTRPPEHCVRIGGGTPHHLREEDECKSSQVVLEIEQDVLRHYRNRDDRRPGSGIHVSGSRLLSPRSCIAGVGFA